MKQGKDIGKQGYLFKLKARPSFSSVEASTYKRSWGYLVESLVKAGGYFPRLTALFTLICRTKLSDVNPFTKCMLFREDGPLKGWTICGKVSEDPHLPLRYLYFLCNEGTQYDDIQHSRGCQTWSLRSSFALEIAEKLLVRVVHWAHLALLAVSLNLLGGGLPLVVSYSEDTIMSERKTNQFCKHV